MIKAQNNGCVKNVVDSAIMCYNANRNRKGDKRFFELCLN